MPTPAFRLLLNDYRVKLVAVAAILSVLWACYRVRKSAIQTRRNRPLTSGSSRWELAALKSSSQFDIAEKMIGGLDPAIRASAYRLNSLPA